MYEGTDQHGNTITPSSIEPLSMYYEIPVVFVVDASEPVVGADSRGRFGATVAYGSEAEAAELVCQALQDADFRNGSEATPWLDCWTMPANQDITDADNRSGTIVYGSDCAFLARLCNDALRTAVLSPGDLERAERLADYLARYAFDGA